MKVICVQPYLTMVVGKEYDAIERINTNDVKIIGCDKPNTSLLRISRDIPCIGVRVSPFREFDDSGNKFFKTREEIRNDKLNNIFK